MRILISSYAFAPSIGGIESVTKMLAEEFVACGHEVIVVTDISSNNEEIVSLYQVVRRPSFFELFPLIKKADIYLQNNISLRYATPLLFCRKPKWVVVQQDWAVSKEKTKTIVNRVKNLLLQKAHSICICSEMQRNFQFISTVIPNPYDDSIFKNLGNKERNLELVFLGRLVSLKGVDLLIEAMSFLKREGKTPNLSIVGVGPEEGNLKSLVRSLGLSKQVQFYPPKKGEELVGFLNRHKIMVVPSRWEEPFGVVALEGIACGCVVLGSNAGGLVDAIGSCGELFERNNAQDLAEKIERLLYQKDLQSYYECSKEHLAKFSKKKIALSYLEVFSKLLNLVD